MDFSHSLLGFWCLFSSISQQVSVCRKFRNTTTAITTGITSPASLTAAALYARVGYSNLKLLIIKKSDLGSNTDGKKGRL